MALGDDYGLAAGLAFKTNYGDAVNNEINDLKYSIQQRKENEALAMAKAKMLSSDIEFQQGTNPIDAAIIKEENTQLLRDIGKFDTEHQHEILTNPYVMGQRKLMVKSYAQTPAVLRSVAWKTAVDQYNKYAQTALKDPSKYNLDQLKAFEVQMNNYGKDENGNPLPKDQIKPLVFTPPEDLVDMDKLEKETGTALEPQTYEPLKNGRDGSFIGYLSDKDALEQAAGIYKSNVSTYNYKNKGVPPEEIIKGIAKRLKNYTPIKYDIGDRNPVTDALAIAAGKARIEAIENAKSAGKQVDPYALLLNDRYTKDDPKDLAATFGTNVPYSYTDAKGNLVKAQGEDFNYEGTIFDKGYNKEGKYTRSGIKVTPGYVEKPISWGKDEGFLTSPMWGDPEVKPEFQDRVKIVSGPIGNDGKAAKVIQLKVFNEVAANSPKYAMKYNKQFATTKQRDILGINESMLEDAINYPAVGTKQGGYEYIGGDPASKNSWKKL